jgi:cytochrome c-type biogenesis protein CcmE
MTRKRRRLWLLVGCGVGLGSATALTLSAFSDNLVFFVTPSDILARHLGAGHTLRLGGLVQAGSVRRAVVDGEPAARFRITDGKQAVTVNYVGILPDLFREGQGVVTLGEMEPDGSFRASEVLAKHDENYMPKDVAAALKRAGYWNPRNGPPPAGATWDTATLGKAGG